jgi:subtilisin family serine protease
MKKSRFLRWSLLVVSVLLASMVHAQHSWVYFTDKGEGINHLDSSVNAAYLNALKSEGLEIIGTSKWFNSAVVKGYPTYLESLPFVTDVKPLGKYKITQHQVQKAQADFSYGNSDWQLEMLGLDSFHRKGYTGKGVTIALFDAGFYKADTVYAFDSLWQQNRIKGYWDFITNDTTIFWEYDGHGKYVLSIVGANWPDSMMGAAPHANFLLARTENVDSETHLEEYAWVKALEWADSMGADIIHSSLGYSLFDTLEGDYDYWDMDGQSTIVTKATDVAFSKGIFVTNSAGNEGNDPWHYITAPCDGRYVLCVGAVDSNRVHADFSSYGPSADGRVKPDVVAMGQGVTYINNQARLKTGDGTSFSGPLIAGFVACLKEAWPNLTNIQIYNAVIQSADRYNNPDTAYGYGLPNIIKADSLLREFAQIEEIETKNVRVYPNPFSDVIRIESKSVIDRISVIGLDGRTIMEKTDIKDVSIEMNAATLKPSVYMMVIHLEGGNVQVQRLKKIKN